MMHGNSSERRSIENESGKPLLLFFPFELLAHYLRCLILARQLEPYFEIRFAHSERYGRFIEQDGFHTFHCTGLNPDMVMACARNFDFSWINLQTLEAVLKQQVEIINVLNPAVVLGDTMPTLRMAAEVRGVPYVTLQNGYMTKYYADVRKMSWRHPLYKYFQHLPQGLTDALTKLGEQHMFHKIHQPFRQLRQQHGLLKKCYYPDELEGDLNLVCDLPELFPQQSLPKHYIIIPPLIYETTANADMINHRLQSGMKTLFVSMGSSGDWHQVAFLNHPFFHKYNIIAAGDVNKVVQGPHVIPEAFVNVKDVFPLVDLIICHGGNGTIYQALQAGIPVLCKTAHFEQEWNVQALEKHSLGTSLDGLQTTTDHIKKIETWVGKKGSAPFRYIQTCLRESNDFTPMIEQIFKLAPTREYVLQSSQQRA